MLTTSCTYTHSRTSRPEFTQQLRLRTSYVRSRHIMDLFWVAAIHIARLPTVWRVIAHAPPRASSQDLDNRVRSYKFGPHSLKGLHHNYAHGFPDVFTAVQISISGSYPHRPTWSPPRILLADRDVDEKKKKRSRPSKSNNRL